MGLSLFSRCTHGALPQVEIREPDFSAYSVLQAVRIGKCSVVRVRYHNAKNYEGIKILVYKGEAPAKLDPHFCESHQSPIARFEPTKNGWNMALAFAESVRLSA